MASNPDRGFRYPAGMIRHAVWLYHCFSLSLRDVELILAARGVVVSYDAIRERNPRFGRLFANVLKRRRPRPAPSCFSTRFSSAFEASCIITAARSTKTSTCSTFSSSSGNSLSASVRSSLRAFRLPT
jgi:hypothetical protein